MGKKIKTIVKGVATGIIIVFALITFFGCMKKVPAGYAGIIYNMNGGIEDKVLNQGWHWVGPLKEVTTYSIGIEQSYLTADSKGDSEEDESFEVPSSDGKGLQVDLTFTYRYDVETLPRLFTRFKGQSGKEVRDSFIKPNIISWTKEVTAKYPVVEIFGDKRADLNIDLTNYISKKFKQYDIIVENISLIDVRADDNTKKAIQRKITAQQDLEVAQIEQKTANVQAKKDKEVALIQAEQQKETAAIKAERQKIEAEGEAEAMRIKAEAEAEANKKIAESLTEELIEKQKIDKWNGSVPQVSGSTTPIVTVE